MPADDARAYLEEQGVHAALAEAVATVCRERPADALARIADLLCVKTGKAALPPPTTDYLSTVGKTPLVRLGKMLPADCKAKAVYVKLEMQNPGGSIKDRIAKNILDEAEKSGKLKPGMTVVEGTSGNTGIGLAMACAARGYKCIIMMPQVPPMFERYIIARQFGAEVILTAPAKGFNGLLGAFKELIASDPDKYFGANQFFNGDNPAAHYATTGPEIWAQCPEIDYFIHGVGTGGTIGGAGKYLKEKNPSLKVLAIEPSNSRVHVGETPSGPHSIVGIGAGVKTHFLSATTDETFVNPSVVDEWTHCTGDDAIEYAGKACTEEGMMVGPSAGAALKIACDLSVKPEAAGKTIVVVQPSHGIRYVNHPMWAAVKKEATAALPVPPNMAKDCENVLWKSSDYTPPPAE